MSAPTTIDEYVATLTPKAGEIVAATRAVIDRHLEDASCAILWGHPTWSVGHDPVCYLRAMADEVLFGFWNAATLNDPSGRMKAHGSIMGHATLREPADVDEDLFAGWLREARGLARPQGPVSQQLAPLDRVVGEWATEATHPAFPSTVVHGVTEFEWLEGGRFLIQRSRVDHPDFPDAIAILGVVDDALRYHYFDSRGVHRVYDLAVSDRGWRLARDTPGFFQRLTATYDADADAITATSQISSDDGSTWSDDLAMTYRRLR